MSDTSAKPLILVDGSSYLFRAFYALPNLTNAKRQPTGAILGVINMLRKLLKDYDPELIAVVFDAKGKNFRHELYSDYKANRDAMPEDLAVQIQPLHDMVRAMGLPLVAVEGVEADDVIGTLSHFATTKGQDVVISTGDKDMAQLVNDHVSLVDTMKDKKLNRDGVKEKYGVFPEQIIDYLSLMGDASDNIPGVPKCGPKTAVKWINEYGSLAAVKENADKIGGKVGENLRANLEQLDLAQQLTTIKLDVELDLDWQQLKKQDMDEAKLADQCREWGFSSWLKSLGAEEKKADAPQADRSNYECIQTAKQWQDWQDKIRKSGCFAFDTETTGLDPMTAELVGVSFSVKAGEAAYLPLQHCGVDSPEQLPFNDALADLKALLEDLSVLKVGQNLKYDIKVLEKYDVHLQGFHFDTMLASYVLEAGLGRHNMNDLAERHLGLKTIHYEDLVGKGAKQISFADVALEEAVPYAAEDADITWQLYEHFKAELAKEPALEKLFFEEEMPVAQVLARMELGGVLLDVPELNKQSTLLDETIHALEQKAYELAEGPFNLASPKQLQEILFEKMQLPVVKKTPKGQPSTNEEVLQELANEYELPKVLLEFRHLSKLKSTYTDKLPLMVNERTGRVHTSYHQAVAVTGRLSSSDPNLQNIPVRTEQGRAIRKAFIAPEGRQILASDYSQIELRIMAHLSQDKGLLTAFANDEDIHRATASEVFDVAKEDVTTDQRRSAKAVNFGLIYGMSAFGLAKQLGIERALAAKYIDIYFERYPGVHEYMESTRAKAAEHGFVETLFGRRLYLPEINSKNGMRRQAAERAAINAPMQGTAADIIKRAMIAMDAELQTGQWSAQMLMQVHDELVFEVDQSQVTDFTPVVDRLMTSAADLDVPLTVSIDVGENWDDAH